MGVFVDIPVEDAGDIMTDVTLGLGMADSVWTLVKCEARTGFLERGKKVVVNGSSKQDRNFWPKAPLPVPLLKSGCKR